MGLILGKGAVAADQQVSEAEEWAMPFDHAAPDARDVDDLWAADVQAAVPGILKRSRLYGVHERRWRAILVPRVGACSSS